MTAQVPETLLIDGGTLAMCAEPLGHYFELANLKPPFATWGNTACWRGYVGTWEIHDGHLYLVGISGMIEDGSEASLERLFPGQGGRVLARWYSGVIRCPRGALLKYVHMGYSSTYEEDLLITVERGLVTGREVRRNGNALRREPSGYQIAAWTVFPKRGNHGE